VIFVLFVFFVFVFFVIVVTRLEQGQSRGYTFMIVRPTFPAI